MNTSEYSEIQERACQLHGVRLPAWAELPDKIRSKALCRQVQETLHPLFPHREEILTPAMLQNYLRWGILPPVTGRRYSREHVARILAISLLKNILTINEVKEGICLQLRLCTSEEAYEIFREECIEAIHALAEAILHVAESGSVCSIEFSACTKESKRAATSAACRALAYQILTRSILAEGGLAGQLESYPIP